jgi:hypothetical protein
MLTKATRSLLFISALAASAHGATYVVTTKFDGTFDTTLTDPFIGTGVFTYDSGPLPGSGVWPLADFTNPSLAITFGTTTFTLADLVTPAGEVHLVLVGSEFYFANSSFLPSGPFGGAADFAKDSFSLSTEPTGLDGIPLFLGNFGAPAFLSNTSLGSINGNYGITGVSAIPEPSSLGALGALLSLGLFMRHRKS